MIKVLCIAGTRPEAIKLAPVIRELAKYPEIIESRVCVTAQHREMLDQVLELFEITPDIDLDLMRPNQTLSALTARILENMSHVLAEEDPDWVLVQGDTSTVMATALAAFNQRVSVGHVEAGLRTNDRYNPFPEEINRRLVSVLATYHFAPTVRARNVLVAEGIPSERVFVTGNTVIDAIRWILSSPISGDTVELFNKLSIPVPPEEEDGVRIVLVTAHRRESFGAPFESICRGLRAIADENDDVLVVYPVHLNPRVREPVNRMLSNHPRIQLIEPLAYEPFIHLMNQSHIVITDSGGIQEEVSVIGKPVLILRDITERPEVVEAGIARLVGTDEKRLALETKRLLRDTNAYKAMARKMSLFGDGTAAFRIVEILRKSAREGARS